MGSFTNVQTVKLLLATACSRGLVGLDKACAFLLSAGQTMPLRLAWTDALLCDQSQVQSACLFAH